MSDEHARPISRRPRAIILGCAGDSLSRRERAFFAAADPLGFILFRRNCRDPRQVEGLVAALRDCVGRPDAPVLIDQEGGRVARLRPPYWRAYPAAAALADLPDPDAERAVRLGARLIADDLSALGITIDCAPVLDVATPQTDPVIGDRSYGGDPARVARLGGAFRDGLLAGGVLPVLKHIPGHGRARVDSHFACPRVDADRAALARTDFAPFRALAALPWAMPWAMTAHVVFTAIDMAAPATLSPTVIADVIRGEIGFDGVLISDDVSMGALDGTLAERTCRALAAGCDLVLHCTGDMAEMEAVADAAAAISDAAAERVARGEALRRRARPRFDRRAAEAEFAALLDEAAVEARQ